MLILSSRVLRSLSRPSKKLLELNNYTMFSYTHSCMQIYSFILYYVAKEDRAIHKSVHNRFIMYHAIPDVFSRPFVSLKNKLFN